MKVTRLPRSHKPLKKDTLGVEDWQDGSAHKTISEAHGGKENWLPNTVLCLRHVHRHARTQEWNSLKSKLNNWVLTRGAGRSLSLLSDSLIPTFQEMLANRRSNLSCLPRVGFLLPELSIQHFCLCPFFLGVKDKFLYIPCWSGTLNVRSHASTPKY